MSLLTIIQRASAEVGASNVINRVIGNTNQLVSQLLEHCRQTGEALSSIGDFNDLRREWTHTTIASETQTGAIPADFDHFIRETLWNRTRRRELTPVSAEEWQRMQATVSSPVVDMIYIRGKQLLMSPVPEAGQILSGEYITRAYATDATGATYLTDWAADTDLPLLPENIYVLGTALRYKASVGLDAADTAQKYRDAVDGLLAQQNLVSRISLTGTRMIHRGMNAPEGDWNVS